MCKTNHLPELMIPQRNRNRAASDDEGSLLPSNTTLTNHKSKGIQNKGRQISDEKTSFEEQSSFEWENDHADQTFVSPCAKKKKRAVSFDMDRHNGKESRPKRDKYEQFCCDSVVGRDMESVSRQRDKESASRHREKERRHKTQDHAKDARHKHQEDECQHRNARDKKRADENKHSSDKKRAGSSEKLQTSDRKCSSDSEKRRSSTAKNPGDNEKRHLLDNKEKKSLDCYSSVSERRKPSRNALDYHHSSPDTRRHMFSRSYSSDCERRHLSNRMCEPRYDSQFDVNERPRTSHSGYASDRERRFMSETDINNRLRGRRTPDYTQPYGSRHISSNYEYASTRGMSETTPNGDRIRFHVSDWSDHKYANYVNNKNTFSGRQQYSPYGLPYTEKLLNNQPRHDKYLNIPNRTNRRLPRQYSAPSYYHDQSPQAYSERCSSTSPKYSPNSPNYASASQHYARYMHCDRLPATYRNAARRRSQSVMDLPPTARDFGACADTVYCRKQYRISACRSIELSSPTYGTFMPDTDITLCTDQPCVQPNQSLSLILTGAKQPAQPNENSSIMSRGNLYSRPNDVTPFAPSLKVSAQTSGATAVTSSHDCVLRKISEASDIIIDSATSLSPPEITSLLSDDPKFIRPIVMSRDLASGSPIETMHFKSCDYLNETSNIASMYGSDIQVHATASSPQNACFAGPFVGSTESAYVTESCAPNLCVTAPLPTYKSNTGIIRPLGTGATEKHHVPSKTHNELFKSQESAFSEYTKAPQLAKTQNALIVDSTVRAHGAQYDGNGESLLLPKASELLAVLTPSASFTDSAREVRPSHNTSQAPADYTESSPYLVISANIHRSSEEDNDTGRDATQRVNTDSNKVIGIKTDLDGHSRMYALNGKQLTPINAKIKHTVLNTKDENKNMQNNLNETHFPLENTQDDKCVLETFDPLSPQCVDVEKSTNENSAPNLRQENEEANQRNSLQLKDTSDPQHCSLDNNHNKLTSGSTPVLKVSTGTQTTFSGSGKLKRQISDGSKSTTSSRRGHATVLKHKVVFYQNRFIPIQAVQPLKLPSPKRLSKHRSGSKQSSHISGSKHSVLVSETGSHNSRSNQAENVIKTEAQPEPGADTNIPGQISAGDKNKPSIESNGKEQPPNIGDQSEKEQTKSTAIPQPGSSKEVSNESHRAGDKTDLSHENQTSNTVETYANIYNPVETKNRYIQTEETMMDQLDEEEVCETVPEQNPDPENTLSRQASDKVHVVLHKITDILQDNRSESVKQKETIVHVKQCRKAKSSRKVNRILNYIFVSIGIVLFLAVFLAITLSSLL